MTDQFTNHGRIELLTYRQWQSSKKIDMWDIVWTGEDEGVTTPFIFSMLSLELPKHIEVTKGEYKNLASMHKPQHWIFINSVLSPTQIMMIICVHMLTASHCISYTGIAWVDIHRHLLVEHWKFKVSRKVALRIFVTMVRWKIWSVSRVFAALTYNYDHGKYHEHKEQVLRNKFYAKIARKRLLSHHGLVLTLTSNWRNIHCIGTPQTCGANLT